MYDELIKRLRTDSKALFSAGWVKTSDLAREAADAIEDLENKLNLCRQDKISRWIPVTERLPKSNGVYLVNNGDRVWTCNFVLLGEVRGWANSARNPVVRAWMPLPEPPKEGT